MECVVAFLTGTNQKSMEGISVIIVAYCSSISQINDEQKNQRKFVVNVFPSRHGFFVICNTSFLKFTTSVLNNEDNFLSQFVYYILIKL